jgi:hypothetical protein
MSTRLNVLTGDNVLIGGFFVTGNAPKKVMLRGIGPSLATAGVTGALADPTIELHLGDGSVIPNDNWKIDDQTGLSQEAQIRATTIAPSNDLESAIVATLAPGSYTVILRGKNGGIGTGLIEAYDLDQTSPARLGNTSTRGFVGTGSNVMIGGFILGPFGSPPARVVVRGIGPSLSKAGIAVPLQDPSLELHDGNGQKIASNDDWQDDLAAQEVRAEKLDPTDPRESVLLRILPPGAYTAVLAGKNDTIGVGLVELYNLQ